ncbi:MAG: FUSC family protein [Clostridium sp.]
MMSEGIIFATITMGILGFAKRDFTVLTIRKLVGLWGIYMVLSILAFICGINNYLGIIINLITIFSVIYIFVSEYEEQIYYPLVMYYMYMQINQISIGELPLRLGVTSMGVLIMVLILFIIQKRKDNYTESIIVVIENILENKKVDNIISNISKTIYRKRKGNYYITTGDRKVINIIFALERLSKVQDDQLETRLIQIKNYINGYTEELKIISDIDDNSRIYNFIVKNIHELEVLDKRKKNEFKYNWSKADLFSIKEILKRNFNGKSLKFTFAFKMSVGLSILNFITNYVGVVKFSWVMITVMVLLQPYFEDTLVKGINRFKGASIGCVIFGILFNMFQSNSIRVFIIIVASLIYIKVDEYYKKQIFMTFITVGTAAFTLDVNMLIPRRILFIGIGIVIAYLIESIVFPYKKETGEKELKSKLNEDLGLIKIEELKSVTGDENLENLRCLVLRAIMLSNKLGNDARDDILNECCEISGKVLRKYI